MSASINDTELLAQLKTGDLAAFRHFYIAYREWLYITAFTILKNETEAQELVQEFFIDFWQKNLGARINLDTTPSLKNFLFVSVRNRCLNRIARDATRNKRLREIMLPEGYVPPHGRLENNELKEQLETAISRLPERHGRRRRLQYRSGQRGCRTGRWRWPAGRGAPAGARRLRRQGGRDDPPQA